jgi:glycine cleavage system H protein
VYSPVSGEVTVSNNVLADGPETINKDPYGDGWMFKIRPSNPAEWDSLLDAVAYNAQVAAEKH